MSHREGIGPPDHEPIALEDIVRAVQERGSAPHSERGPDRKRAERYGLHLALIVESSDDAIVSKDLDGIIHGWNWGAEQLFGYSSAEVVGKPVTILIPSDRQEEEGQDFGRIRRGERVDHYETVRQRKDGSLVDISLTVSPIRDAKAGSSARRKSRAILPSESARKNWSTCSRARSTIGPRTCSPWCRRPYI